MSQAEVIAFALIFFGAVFLFSRWAMAQDRKWITKHAQKLRGTTEQEDSEALRKHWEREDREAERRAWVDGDKNARPPWRRR